METIVTEIFKRPFEKPIIFEHILVRNGDEVRFPIREASATLKICKANGNCVVSIPEDKEHATILNTPHQRCKGKRIYLEGIPLFSYSDEIFIRRA